MDRPQIRESVLVRRSALSERRYQACAVRFVRITVVQYQPDDPRPPGVPTSSHTPHVESKFSLLDMKFE